MKVTVHGAPGYDRFDASVVPGLHKVTDVDSRGPLTVVADSAGELHVIPSRNVFTPEGLRYAEEWSVKAGRSVTEVYIPEALEVKL